MARMMTEEELLAFYETNRQQAILFRSEGQLTTAWIHRRCMREIEKHLYRFRDEAALPGDSGEMLSEP